MRSWSGKSKETKKTPASSAARGRARYAALLSIGVAVGATLPAAAALADGPSPLAAATAAVREAAAACSRPTARGSWVKPAAAPRYSTPLLALMDSAATAVVAPSSVGQVVLAGVDLVRVLSAPVTIAGWSTAFAAASHVDTIRIQFRAAVGRPAPLACTSDVMAFSIEGHERLLMRQAELAGKSRRTR